jgi:ABC-type microcin C transport system permease subunit YejE
MMHGQTQIMDLLCLPAMLGLLFQPNIDAHLQVMLLFSWSKVKDKHPYA